MFVRREVEGEAKGGREGASSSVGGSGRGEVGPMLGDEPGEGAGVLSETERLEEHLGE